MDWASASGALSWDAAAADLGSTVLSFAGPSSCTANATEVSLQEFASILVQPVVRPAGAAGARRSRVAVGGEACSVDGCRSDLTHCREYHRRHKVCEEHSKTPVVVVGGQEQRFCQQCSRFHMLSEFDNGKRSCRKRLDGHNRRRRKSQHDVTNLGRFFPYNQGPDGGAHRYGSPHGAVSLLQRPSPRCRAPPPAPSPLESGVQCPPPGVPRRRGTFGRRSILGRPRRTAGAPSPFHP